MICCKPYIICEPFAGSAALTYGLFGCKPPISYLGAKTGYREPIYDALGISPLNPPSGIVLGEVGPFAAVHAALCGATGVDAGEVAKMVIAYRWSFSEKGPNHGYGSPGASKGGTWGMEARDAAIGIPKTTTTLESLPSPAASQVAAIIRSWKDEVPRELWERLKADGWPSLMPVPGGRWLGPQSIKEVAAWIQTGVWAYKQGDHDSGGPVLPGDRRQDTSAVAVAVAKVPRLPPVAVWQGTAETLALPDDLSGWVIVADPPYKGDGKRKITGYPHGDCSRETVLRLLREWSERGATVACCESVGLAGDLGKDWYNVEIGHARKGQKRTFSNEQAEWLTLNREPSHRPPKQVGLFGSTIVSSPA